MTYGENSVDVDRQVYPYEEDQKSLGGRHCWEMRGPCLQHYDNAAPTLNNILEGSGNDSSGATIIGPFMIGKKPAKARPYIIVCSVHGKARTTVKKKIDKSGIPGRMGFRTHALNYYPSGNIKQFATSLDQGNGTSMSSQHIPNLEGERSALQQSAIQYPSLAYYDPRQQIRKTGLSTYAKADTGLRMATANAVFNGRVFGYLTVAHLFASWSEDASVVERRGEELDMLPDSDSDDESCDGTHELLDETLSSASVQRSDHLIRDRGTVETSAGGLELSTPSSSHLPHPSELNTLGEVTALEDIHCSLDYAIITIEDSKLRQQDKDATLSWRSQPTYVRSAKPKSSRATAWTTHGPVNGRLRASSILIRLPESKSFRAIYAFEYEGTIKQGDCGSLVLDTTSKELYGMIIAASERQSIVYIVAAVELLGHIGIDGWRLLDVDHDYMKSGPVEVETTPAHSPSDRNSREVSSPLKSIQANALPTFVPQATSIKFSPDPEWNVQFQRYLITLWNEQYRRHYWTHHVEGQGWVFFDWVPMPITQVAPQDQYQYERYGGRGQTVYATYDPINPRPSSHFEPLDPSFYVRGSNFFEEGKVFSVLFTEAAGTNALNKLNPMADYNTNLSKVKYDEFVHTQVRRFIVVKRKREFCFAVPIFTYYGQATTKSGVVPDEHAIAYSLGQQPELVQGEAKLRKVPIPIVMEENNRPLVAASRIYFAIHHPIQYNVKVKNLGYVHPDYLPTFLGYWNQENSDSKQDSEVVQSSSYEERF